MRKLILRATCVGIASVAIVTFIAGFVALSLLFMNSAPSSDQQTGYDSFFITVHGLTRVALIVLGVFAIGFYFGFRYFSKREKRQAGHL